MIFATFVSITKAEISVLVCYKTPWDAYH